MYYTILAYQPRDHFADCANAAKNEAFGAYLQAMQDAGVFVSCGGLQTPDNAAVLIEQGERRRVQDGPYADTKEQLAGFITIDVPDMDAALDWAARCPPKPGRVLEVRPNLQSMTK